jgi:hypothetical protein
VERREPSMAKALKSSPSMTSTEAAMIQPVIVRR